MAADIWHRGKLNIEDQLFRRAIPHCVELESHISKAVKNHWPKQRLEILELGCGTGFATAAILSQRPNLELTALDNDLRSLTQARRNLRPWAGSVKFVHSDILPYLARKPAASFDAIATKYTLHNLNQSYREATLRHIHRVLRPGGLFVNADKYALQGRAHQIELRKQMIRYLDLFLPLNRQDLLQEALEHTLADENETRIMRERKAHFDMRRRGFRAIKRVFRRGMDAVYRATK